MKQVLLLLFLLCLLLTVSESNLRRRNRRQYSGYNYIQQYNNQYGLYGPGGQGWINNYDNRYPNGNFAWNNNYNWNHGNRLPEYYYNSGKTIQPSVLIFLVLLLV